MLDDHWRRIWTSIDGRATESGARVDDADLAIDDGGADLGIGDGELVTDGEDLATCDEASGIEIALDNPVGR